MTASRCASGRFDTALHSVRWLDDLETAVGKPVITANQATIWHAWQLTGAATSQPGMGALFRIANARTAAVA